MKLKRLIFILFLPFVLLILSHRLEAAINKIFGPGSVKACAIKKLIVYVTRLTFIAHTDSEPPITHVIVNYYDPQSATGKTMGKTNQSTNGRGFSPIWSPEDGIVETDDPLSSDLALEFIVMAKTKNVSPLYCPVTQKIPILGQNGLEGKTEFHSMILHHHSNTLWWPKGTAETCTVNNLGTAVFPFALTDVGAHCVYGHIYYIVKYIKEDPECDDTSRKTTPEKKSSEKSEELEKD